MIVARLSIAPLDKGISVSKYVNAALEEIKKSGLNYEVGAMSTTIEADGLETLFDAVKNAHLAVIKLGSKRVITELKIDDRIDKKHSISSKIESVKN